MQVLLTPKYNANLNVANNNSKNGFPIRLKPQLTSDQVSFQGKRDLLDLSVKSIFSKINKSIKNKSNFLGQGCEGKVYKIEDSEYCIKIPSNNLFSKKINYKSDFTKDVSEKDKINHIVARLGDGAVIMRKIEGTPVWSKTMSDESAREVSETVANFPLGSYQGFLRQISHAHNNGMMFDPFNQNVIVDKNNKTITAIDFIDNSGLTFEELNPLQLMYLTSTNKYSTVEHKERIAKNILNAVLEEFKPSHEPCLDVSQFDFNSYLKMLDSQKVIKYNNQMDKKLSKLVDVKYLESQGENKNEELSYLLTDIKDMINF